MLDDAGLQAECNHLTIAQLPDFLTWIPLATGLLHPLSEVDFRKANTQGDSLVSWYLRYWRSEEHTSELQSLAYLVCRLLLEKKKMPAGLELTVRNLFRLPRSAAVCSR